MASASAHRLGPDAYVAAAELLATTQAELERYKVAQLAASARAANLAVALREAIAFIEGHSVLLTPLEIERVNMIRRALERAVDSVHARGAR